MAISFRDPDGRLFVVRDRVLRVVTKTGAENLNAFLASAVAEKFVATGQLARTHLPDADGVKLLSEHLQRDSGRDEALEAIFEHERIAFPSFPYEWAPEMLYRAGRLTLDLAESSLIEGFGLKDATPYNVCCFAARNRFSSIYSLLSRAIRSILFGSLTRNSSGSFCCRCWRINISDWN
jgi:hypothetical protein